MIVAGIPLQRVEGGWDGEYAGYRFEVLGPRATGLSHTGRHWSVWVRPSDRPYIVAANFNGTSLLDGVQSVKVLADKGGLARNVARWLADHPVSQGS